MHNIYFFYQKFAENEFKAKNCAAWIFLAFQIWNSEIENDRNVSGTDIWESPDTKPKPDIHERKMNFGRVKYKHKIHYRKTKNKNKISLPKYSTPFEFFLYFFWKI